jgi:DnaJ-class molecular chaperone
MSNPTCTRCYVETAECSVCDGTGEMRNMGIYAPSPCTECDGTGYLCEANDHGKFWNS